MQDHDPAENVGRTIHNHHPAKTTHRAGLTVQLEQQLQHLIVRPAAVDPPRPAGPGRGRVPDAPVLGARARHPLERVH
jgi:hypothetical protein